MSSRTLNCVIILEGPDACGKTTAAEFLARELRGEVWHEGPPPPDRDQLVHYGRELMRALTHSRPVVFDRLHLGEQIYGKICRDSDTLTDHGRRLIDRMCSAWRVPILVFLPPVDTAMANFEKKLMGGGEYVDKVARWVQVYNEYVDFVRRFKYSVIDYTRNDYEPLLRMATQYQCLLPTTLPFPDLCGSYEARYLLVGDRPNGELDLPFFALNNSSGYLDQVLVAAGFTEDQLALTNAHDIRGRRRDFIPILSSLPYVKRVIALGKEASKVLTIGHVEHELVPHPAFARRFYFNETKDYVERFKQIRRKRTHETPAV